MQVKLEPVEDGSYDLYDFSSDALEVKREDRSSSDDEDDEFEEVGLDSEQPEASTANVPLASRQADNEDHPALVLQRQREAEEAVAAAATGELGGEVERRIFKDGKGGNKPIEVQLAVAEDASTSKKGKKRAVTYTPAQRVAHLNGHKIHLLSLLSSTAFLNRQSQSHLLQARLLSILPPHLVTAFAEITPANQPNRTTRGRAFEKALERLVEWWTEEWEVDWRAGIRYRTWLEGTEMGTTLGNERAAIQKAATARSDSKGKGRATDSASSSKADKKRLESFGKAFGGELLRSHKSLQKKALNMQGSRDISALLFVSVARALGIGTRLVVSLQPVGWRMGDGTPFSGAAKPATGQGKGKGRATASDEDSDLEEVDMEPVPLPQPSSQPSTSSAPGPGSSASVPFVRWIDRPASLRVTGMKASLGRQLDHFGSGSPQQATATAAALRVGSGNIASGGTLSKGKRKGAGRKLSSQPVADSNALFDLLSPPVFWAEVFSRPDQDWIPVDPARGFIRRTRDFEPKGGAEGKRNKMVYVLGFEEDGAAKDLTPKYCENLDKALKLRVPVIKGKIGQEEDFWGDVVRMLGRNYKLERDVKEDDLLQRNVRKKVTAMPSTLAGFQNHPEYLLERQIKREEVVYPKVQHALFRGEPVYKRSNVLSVKTAETWLRQGREVLSDEEPMKWVKMRAMTIQRRRELEAEKERLGGEEVKQPLYSEAQTRLVRPPKIKDGNIQRNQYGNIDLFVDTMLPPGAVHLKYKGIAKVAKKLGISYADACTGFEFKQKKAIPQLEGVVVAVENAEVLLEAYRETAAIDAEREEKKRKERVLKRWERLITGLKIRRRMQKEYGVSQSTNNDGIAVEMDLGVESFRMPSPDKHIHSKLSAPAVKKEIVESGTRDGRSGESLGHSLLLSDDDERAYEDLENDGDIQVVEKALNPKSLADLLAHEEEEDESDLDVDTKPHSQAPPLQAPTSAIKTSTPRVLLRRPTSTPTHALSEHSPGRRATRSSATTGQASGSRSSFRKRPRATLSSDDDNSPLSDGSSITEVKAVVSSRPTRAAAQKATLRRQAQEIDDSEDEVEAL